MAATKGFRLSPPTSKDVDAAKAAWRDGRLSHQVSADTKFWRVLKVLPPADPLEFAKTCYPSDGKNRFSPVLAHGNIVPAAYAGSTPEIALWEVVLRDIRHKGVKRIPQHATSNRYLVETSRPAPPCRYKPRRWTQTSATAQRRARIRVRHHARVGAATLHANSWHRRVHLRITPSAGRLHRSISVHRSQSLQACRCCPTGQRGARSLDPQERSKEGRRRRRFRPPARPAGHLT
jgi:hypothetical protein